MSAVETIKASRSDVCGVDNSRLVPDRAGHDISGRPDIRRHCGEDPADPGCGGRRAADPSRHGRCAGHHQGRSPKWRFP